MTKFHRLKLVIGETDIETFFVVKVQCGRMLQTFGSDY